MSSNQIMAPGILSSLDQISESNFHGLSR